MTLIPDRMGAMTHACVSMRRFDAGGRLETEIALECDGQSATTFKMNTNSLQQITGACSRKRESWHPLLSD
ncbi:MAG: hypothetical protein AAF497_08650 [Planctomycetota bacterium]